MGNALEQRTISERLVGPKVKPVSDSQFARQTFDRSQRIQRVVLPLLARGEDVRLECDAQMRGLGFNSRHVFGAQIDGLVKDGQRFQFGDGLKGGA